MSEQTLASRMNRAKSIDKFMTAVFYGVAIFFMALLVAFAGKVIIGGLMGASPEMFAFRREGSVGNQLFNTIYLVFIALVFSIPVAACSPVFIWRSTQNRGQSRDSCAFVSRRCLLCHPSLSVFSVIWYFWSCLAWTRACSSVRCLFPS